MDLAFHFPTTPQAVKAQALGLRPRDSVETAFQAILRNCIEQVQANAQGVAKFHHVESLHQMRVGLRRLRAGLSLFRQIVSLPPALQHDLDWLVAALGPARDWDVLAETTLARVAGGLGEAPALDSMKLAALDKARALHDAASEAVRSARYAAFMEGMQEWIEERAWREVRLPGDKKTLAMPVKAFGAPLLAQAQRRLRKRGEQADWNDAPARHRVRIAAKKARYAAEFLGALAPRSVVKGYVGRLARLQDILGRLNDDAVALPLAEAACLVRGYLAADTVCGKGQLKRRWKRLKPEQRVL